MTKIEEIFPKPWNDPENWEKSLARSKQLLSFRLDRENRFTRRDPERIPTRTYEYSTFSAKRVKEKFGREREERKGKGYEIPIREGGLIILSGPFPRRRRRRPSINGGIINRSSRASVKRLRARGGEPDTAKGGERVADQRRCMRKKVKLRKHLANDDYHTLGLARCSPLAFEAPERDRYATSYGTPPCATCICNQLNFATSPVDDVSVRLRNLLDHPEKKITRSRIRYLGSTSYVSSFSRSSRETGEEGK